jgi:hypothetical protein
MIFHKMASDINKEFALRTCGNGLRFFGAPIAQLWEGKHYSFHRSIIDGRG